MPWLLKMTLIVAAIMAIAHGYLGWRACRLIKIRRARYLVIAFLCSFYLYALLGLSYFFIRGDVNMLAVSHPLAYWFWFGLVFSVHLFSWLIILDILQFAGRLIWKNRRSRIENSYFWTFWLLAAGLFVFTATKMYHDTRSIQTNHISYASAKVPPALDDFRIVHITDLQGDEYTGRPQISRYINKVNALQPDLIIFTGDLISYGTDFIPMAAQGLSRAQARYGTYAVIGDHDYWAGVSNIKQALVKNGIYVLQDRNKIISANGDSLLLTGITEVYSKHIPHDSLQVLTRKDSDISLKILATHQATKKVIRQAKNENYQLLLAGHTHGGQLRIPFLFMTFSAAELDTPYLSGPFHFGHLLMNIDNGLGFTLAPVRYNAPPTISVIDLSMKIGR